MSAALRLGLLLALWAVPSLAVAQDFAPTPPPEPTEAGDDFNDPDIDVFFPRRTHAVFKGALGGGVRRLVGSAIGLAQVDFAFGADTRAGSFFGAIGGAGGRTEGGLSFAQFLVGPDLEWSIGILRLGLHPRLGYLAIGRVTSDAPFELMTAGGGALVAVDAIRTNGFVMALGVEPKVEWASSVGLFDENEDEVLYGANLVLQFRYRLPRRTPKEEGGSF